ncbi:hypothetical protein EVAR_78637_1 [Eumeta japonica]|uniref:Uncharacterized protein n=1 Tax=Eumeta variegata TaxID=151549 RepID=A0A4C1U7Z2_EUMVA|nr:hypothetical protein EVAR_78637_1 [Eumeta japonica]
MSQSVRPRSRRNLMTGVGKPASYARAPLVGYRTLFSSAYVTETGSERVCQLYFIDSIYYVLTRESIPATREKMRLLKLISNEITSSEMEPRLVISSPLGATRQLSTGPITLSTAQQWTANALRTRRRYYEDKIRLSRPARNWCASRTRAEIT